jgi:hypothetical protein
VAVSPFNAEKRKRFLEFFKKLMLNASRSMMVIELC